MNCVQLYNLSSDPTEFLDISDRHPDIVVEMIERLEEIEKTMIAPFSGPEVDEGDPDNFGGVYSPGWCTANEQKVKLAYSRQNEPEFIYSFNNLIVDSKTKQSMH